MPLAALSARTSGLDDREQRPRDRRPVTRARPTSTAVRAVASVVGRQRIAVECAVGRPGSAIAGVRDNPRVAVLRRGWIGAGRVVAGIVGVARYVAARRSAARIRWRHGVAVVCGPLRQRQRAGQVLLACGHDLAELKRIANDALAALGDDESLSGYDTAAEGLVEFTAAKGKTSTAWPTGLWDTLPEAERIAKYEAAMDKLTKKKKKFKTPEARLDHCVAVARNCVHYEAAVALHDETGALPDLFDLVVFVASGLARADRPDDAWAVIRAKLGHWWPVEDTQVTPVALLTDPALRPLMTSERCEEVLHTPRGPQAES